MLVHISVALRQNCVYSDMLATLANRSELWCHNQCAAVHVSMAPCKRQTHWNVYDKKKLQHHYPVTSREPQHPHMHKKNIIRHYNSMQCYKVQTRLWHHQACINYFRSLNCKLLQFQHQILVSSFISARKTHSS